MLGVLLAGLLAGIVSGMGIGGGAILIPVILWVTDVTQQQAQGVNLLYFLPTAAVALVTHVKMGVWKRLWQIPHLDRTSGRCRRSFAGIVAGGRTAAEIIRRFSLCRWSGRAL